MTYDFLELGERGNGSDSHGSELCERRRSGWKRVCVVVLKVKR